MQIERMNKGQWGKVRAFFDLRTEEGFVIKGFKIVEGSSGPFVSMPSQKGSNGQYYDSVTADPELKQGITQLAMEAYGEDIMHASPPPFGEEPPPFGDDDIPS